MCGKNHNQGGSFGCGCGCCSCCDPCGQTNNRPCWTTNNCGQNNHDCGCNKNYVYNGSGCGCWDKSRTSIW